MARASRTRRSAGRSVITPITPPSTLFERTKGNANGASPALFDLRGARFVALSETEKMARIASALLKSLTGGDPVTARGLYKNPITFLASWLILLVTNHLPTLPADDPAVWERVRVITFDVFIEPEDRDPLLASKLQEEADGILTWAVEGLHQYWTDGLAEPEAVKIATNDYASAQDSVARFIDTVCTETPSNGGNTTRELHDAYVDWATAERIFAEHRLGRTEFGYALDRLGFAAAKMSRGMVRKGLGIASSGGAPINLPAPGSADSNCGPDGEPPVDPWEGYTDAPPASSYVG
ncbi:phage/plasmid primase, P4 family [Microbacterium sp. Mu-80]|uniref:Phage/plasmid primase, P4 family n=1 Tax=Microbacterium bandirmense TaxID=3122050 RepID=A0ABU8LDK0_9MICO